MVGCADCAVSANVPRETVVFEQHYRLSLVIVRSSDNPEMPLTTQNQLVSMHTSTNKREVNQMSILKKIEIAAAVALTVFIAGTAIGLMVLCTVAKLSGAM